MKGELVNIKTSDRIELPGFFVPANSSKCIIYIHGLTSTFLWRRLPEAIAGAAAKNNCNFFAFDNRGSGLISRFIKGNDRVIVGGALERFEDCAKDIGAAIKFVKRHGCSNIILVGHSTGCQKSVYYQSLTGDRRIKGLVLLGPGSDRDYEIKARGKKFKKLLQSARKMIMAGKGSNILSQPDIMLSARRYWNLHKHGSAEGDIFNYATGRMKRISKIRVPILAVYGSRDQYSIYGPVRELSMIGAAAKCAYTPVVMKGSRHNFEGYENKVASIIIRWLKHG